MSIALEENKNGVHVGEGRAPEPIGCVSLLPQHLADLRRSGLSDCQIAACGFTSSNRQHDVAEWLNWESPAKSIMPCLIFPFVDLDGKGSGYCRVKPDKPRKDKKGKPVKYESPRGLPNRAYFPPATRRAVLQDATVSLVVTEGEKKAARADQEGFPTIGLVGVWGWQKKRDKDEDGNSVGERELIDDLAGVKWQDRQVFIVFDSDAADKHEIQWAEWHLCRVLASHGAVVKIVRLPSGEPGADGKAQKMGLDDFLVTHDPAKLQDLIDAAATPFKPAREEPNEGPEDPHRLARVYISKECLTPKGRTLRYWNGEFHRHDGTCYKATSEKEIRADVTRIVKGELDRINLLALKKHAVEAKEDEPPPQVRHITSRLVSDVIHALASLTLTLSKIEQPAWLGSPGPFPADEIIAAKNHLVHLGSLVTGKPHLCAHTPRFFSANALDYDFLTNAPEPSAWLNFLHHDIWPGDYQSVETLQDLMGYWLTPHTWLQKIGAIVGPRRSGKGTISRVIRGLNGAANVAGPTLSSLGTNFGLWPLIGKNLAIISDARLSGRTDTATVIERLLSISGEDALTIDRKNMAPITTRLPTRVLILSNELPNLRDASGALAGRLVLLQITRSFFGKEDPLLTDRLLKELPGILLWSIKGWQRLRERGFFVQPPASAELLGEMEDLSAPISAFVRDYCEVAIGLSVERADLYLCWRQWCKAGGQKEPGTDALFGRNLRAAVPSIRRSQPRSDTGKQLNHYGGIGLNHEGEGLLTQARDDLTQARHR
ncbi:MAG: phage/plasmid primase, P4 family [Gemmataceae bacterium]